MEKLFTLLVGFRFENIGERLRACLAHDNARRFEGERKVKIVFPDGNEPDYPFWGSHGFILAKTWVGRD